MRFGQPCGMSEKQRGINLREPRTFETNGGKMNTTVVDKNYPGLVEKDYHFELAGDLKVDGNLEIKLEKNIKDFSCQSFPIRKIQCF
jgi:hypothetical protein